FHVTGVQTCALPISELIFGHLLTGSNYDDTEERFGAGRNGLGVKLTNIFSKKFIVETADGKKRYKQTFKNNMSEIQEPEITSCRSEERRVGKERLSH